MTKLKSAEYWDGEIAEYSKTYSSIEIIQLIQQNAIEAALDVVKNSCTILSVPNNEFEVIDKQSITSLINHPNLKL